MTQRNATVATTMASLQLYVSVTKTCVTRHMLLYNTSGSFYGQCLLSNILLATYQTHNQAPVINI